MKETHPINFSTFRIQMSLEKVRHERRCKALEDRLEAFQKICPHDNTRFQEDPSGGNDSELICILCDKSV